jgi:hypothetical protein
MTVEMTAEAVVVTIVVAAEMTVAEDDSLLYKIK